MSRPFPPRSIALALLGSAILVVVIATAVVPGAACASHGPAADGAAPCRAGETAVVVDTTAHQLALCDGGRREATFEVALGSGGVGKRRLGDHKTPLGAYGLGAPRASQDFHLFVPVAYPTPAQARLGYTGSAIGIHGPPRRFARALALLPIPLLDWTAGCIAVRTDGEMDRIAAWLRAHRAPHGAPDVRLEPPPSPAGATDNGAVEVANSALSGVSG